MIIGKKLFESLKEKNNDKNPGHALFGGVEPTKADECPSGKYPKIEISFAYQKYPEASPTNGKFSGKK